MIPAIKENPTTEGSNEKVTGCTAQLLSSRPVTTTVWDAFINEGRGGNRAGIVFPANRLSAIERQSIAASTGYSETAFISASPDSGAFSVEFFTPVERIAMCGHALTTVGAFLAQQGLIDGAASIAVEGYGNVRFLGKGTTGGLTLVNTGSSALRVGNISTEVLRGVERAFGLRVEGGDVEHLSMGVPFLMIKTSREDLLRLRPIQSEILSLSRLAGSIGVYIYALDRVDPTRLHARMFAPAVGIPEETATGMAAGPLVLHLSHLKRNGGIGVDSNTSLVVYQGAGFVDVPSRIEAKVTVLDGGKECVELRGECREVSQ